MNEKYNALFTPWKIGNVEMKNRIVQCSMGGTSLFGWMEPNHFDKEAAYFLLNRAQDGVGLILPGMQCIRSRSTWSSSTRPVQSSSSSSPPAWAAPWRSTAG